MSAYGGERHPFAITVRGPAGGTAPPGGTVTGDLARTGGQVLGVAGVAVAGLLAGALVLVASRRRPVRPH